MGLFPMDCAVCKKSFIWFSGCLDQRCTDCQTNNQKVEVKKGEGKMKKSELEAKLKELELKIIALEARPQQIFCPGHTCTCNHYNYPTYPYQPWYTGPTWMGPISGTLISCSGTTSGGVTFGNDTNINKIVE